MDENRPSLTEAEIADLQQLPKPEMVPTSDAGPNALESLGYKREDSRPATPEAKQPMGPKVSESQLFALVIKNEQGKVPSAETTRAIAADILQAYNITAERSAADRAESEAIINQSLPFTVKPLPGGTYELVTAGAWQFADYFTQIRDHYEKKLKQPANSIKNIPYTLTIASTFRKAFANLGS